jgi:large subunit ribosomal protein L23
MATEILIRPIVTEKLTALGEKLNRYGFVVAKTANKIEVKEAVEKMYGVNVAAVNTIRYAGKVKTRFTKAGVISGQRNSIKKAIITLAEGEKIDFYSNI